MLLQVVDGTTIYFDGPPPKINEAPSLDNATPEAIAPTVSLARAPPATETREAAPEIESSVSDDLGGLEAAEAAAAVTQTTDNQPAPGSTQAEAAAPAPHTDSLDLTDPPTVEDLKTASPQVSGGSPDHGGRPDIQADKVAVEASPEDPQNISDHSQMPENPQDAEADDAEEYDDDPDEDF